MAKAIEKKCYWIQFEDVPAIEVEVCAATEKAAKQEATRSWRRHELNRPKIEAIIEMGPAVRKRKGL